MKSFHLAFVIVFMAIPVFLFAHAPSDITLKYDKAKEVLNISISHNVRNVNRHYIESITITINDEDYKNFEYSRQDSLTKHEVNLEIPDLKPGDVVKIRAVCNRIGSRREELIIK